MDLDERNWVVDFGGMKSFKAYLKNTFDHKLLVARDDPARQTFEDLGRAGVADVVVVDATGCEAFAKLIHDGAEAWLHEEGLLDRVHLDHVTVREHGANSATYYKGFF